MCYRRAWLGTWGTLCTTSMHRGWALPCLWLAPFCKGGKGEAVVELRCARRSAHCMTRFLHEGSIRCRGCAQQCDAACAAAFKLAAFGRLSTSQK